MAVFKDILKKCRSDNMKFVKEGVLLTPEEYHKYQRMEACINELQSMKTDFIQTPHEEVEP